MSDTRLEERLRRDLADNARRATTSPDAWERIRDRGRSRRRLPMAAGLGLATAAAAAVAVVAVTSGSQPQLEVTDVTSQNPSPPAATSTPIAPTDDPTDRPSSLDLAWSHVELPPAVAAPAAYSGMQDVAASGETVVAVGYATDDRPAAAFWLSRDGGATWEATDAPSGGGEALAVTASPDGFLAVGGGEETTVWTSTDGVDWTAEVIGIPGTLRAVTLHDERIVAVGEAPGRQGLVLVRDLAGGPWVEAEAPDGSFTTGEETVLYRVATDGDGLVALGYGPSDTIYDVWTSPGGHEWTLVPPEESGLTGVLDAVAPHPDGGYLAIEAGGAVRRSPDGHVWPVVGTLEGAEDATMVRVGGLVHGAHGWVTAGTVDADDGRRFTAWSSVDGTTWAADPAETGRTDAILQGLAATDNGAVAVAEGACDDCDGVATAGVWRAVPAHAR